MNPLFPSADPDRTLTGPPADPSATVDASADSTHPRRPDPPTGAPPVPGYAVTALLARGGMGEVYAAVDLTLDREVAIKTLLPGANADRFVTESKITARLPHPHIPPVYALGTLADGTPFLAMKLVRGRTLSEQLKARPTAHHDLPRFVQVFEQIAQAVGFAHSRGVIHRDLKPLNVMVGEFGEVQVMDWGLAKDTTTRDREGAGDAAPAPSRSRVVPGDHTQAGAVMGTPGYMAPEQARGESVDARADVFALGSVLAAVLTGKPAFVGESVIETVQKAANAKLSDVLSRLNGCGADAELVAVAKRCLSADRDSRPADGRAVAAEVGAYRAGVEARLRQAETDRAEAVVREGEQRKRRRVVQRAGGIVVGVLLAGVVGTGIGLAVALDARRAEKERADGEERAKLAERDATQAARAAEAVAVEEKRNAIAFKNRALDALRATTQSDVAKLLGAKKSLGRNERLYLEAVAERWRGFARVEGTDEQSRAVRAEGHLNLGSLLGRLGRSAEAAAEDQRAADLYGELAAAQPAVTHYRLGWLMGLNNLGLELKRLGRVADAEDRFRAAVTVAEHLAADHPAVEEGRQGAADAHTNLAALLAQRKRPQEAEEHYRLALALRRKLAADFPGRAEFETGLASTHNNLGVLLADRGRVEQAEDEYRQALAIRERLVAAAPDEPAHAIGLANVRVNLGSLFADLRRPADAEEQYRKGIELQSKLAAEFPGVPEYLSDAAKSLHNLGVLLARSGKRAEAEAEYLKAVAARRRLAADFPEVPEYGNGLANTHVSLGNVLAEQGKPSEAEEQYRTGIGVATGLASAFPDRAECRSALANGRYNLGKLLAPTPGRVADAEKEYRQCLTLYRRLADDFPDSPTHRSDLADAHNGLGILLKRAGKTDEAGEQYRAALALREELAADFPAVSKYRQNYAGSCVNLGLLVAAEDPAGGAEWFGKAIDTLRPLRDRVPQDQGIQQELRTAFRNRAKAFDQLRKPREADDDWAKAVELSPADEEYQTRTLRATSKAKAGQTGAAVAEVDELSKSPGGTAPQWYNFACVYALASGQAADAKGEYADRAMAWLQKAVKAGYKNTANLKADKDLAALRGRDDFKKLLADLEANYPPPKPEK